MFVFEYHVTYNKCVKNMLSNKCRFGNKTKRWIRGSLERLDCMSIDRRQINMVNHRDTFSDTELSI
jgi:hypothetical protein